MLFKYFDLFKLFNIFKPSRSNYIRLCFVGLSFNGWDLKLKGASVYVNGPIGHEQSR